MNEAIPAHMDCDRPFMNIQWFKKNMSKDQRKDADRLKLQGAFYEGKFFRGHSNSKSAVRVKSEFSSMGIHAPIDGVVSLKREKTKKITLLHYDCCNYVSWKTKWIRRVDGTATALDMRGARVVQFEDFKLAAAAGEEAMQGLYQKLYLMSPDLHAQLEELGVLVKRELPSELFDFGLCVRKPV
jgi:hypothetical protein